MSSGNDDFEQRVKADLRRIVANTSPEVRARITETLRARKEQLLRAAYLTAVRGDANVTNHFARRLVESKGIVPSLQPAVPAGR